MSNNYYNPYQGSLVKIMSNQFYYVLRDTDILNSIAAYLYSKQSIHSLFTDAQTDLLNSQNSGWISNLKPR